MSGNYADVSNGGSKKSDRKVTGAMVRKEKREKIKKEIESSQKNIIGYMKSKG